MAVIANTFTTGNAVGNREELSDVVSRITPEDTPIYSLIEKGKCVSIHPEWETDDLATPGQNAHEEGEDYTFGNVTPPVRLGDYTQIVRKDWIISGTQEEVSEAGNVQKRKYQRAKKGVEVRKDLEYAIVSNTASVGGTTRFLAGLPSWLVTNVSRGGGGGANGGFSSVTGLTVAATNGTQRAFTKAILDSTMQQGYNSGANLRYVVGSPYVKSVFVTFMSDTNVAQFRYSVSSNGQKNVISATADYYEGPFGKVMMVPNRVQAVNAGVARNLFFVDPDFLSFLWLRKIQDDNDIAKTGDAEKGVIIGEGTLKVSNEKGLGVAADLYGLTSSS